MREPVDLQAEIERRGLELFALPEGSASLVCGEGADQARAWLDEVDGVGGTAGFDLAWAITRSSAASCGASRGAHSDSPARKPDWAPTAGRAPGRRSRSSPAVTPRSNRWRGRCATRRSSRRLGTDDRRAARRRAPDRDRTGARPLGAADHEGGRDRLDDRGPGIEAGHRLPRTLAASSARRSATRSSQSGMATNASVSSGSITPPWNSSVVSLRAREHRAIRGVGREQVALRGDVTTDEERDTRAEQASHELAAVDVVRGVGAQRPADRLVRSSQPRSCTSPATWSSTSSGRSALSQLGALETMVEDRQATFVVGVARGVERAEQLVHTRESVDHAVSMLRRDCSRGRMTEESKTAFGTRLSSLADLDPDRAALTCLGVTVSRRELVLRAQRLAGHLADLGVGPGSIVTIGVPNSIEFVEAMLATWWLGATAQPISDRLAPAERTAILDLAEPAVASRSSGRRGRNAARAQRDSKCDSRPTATAVMSRHSTRSSRPCGRS